MRNANRMPPNFAIEATCLLDRNQTGISRYTRNLIAQLAQLADGGREFVVTQAYRASRWRRRMQLSDSGPLRRQVWQRGWWPPVKPYALVHCPDHRLPHWRIPKIVTIHDVYAALGINFEGANRDKQVAIYADFARRADRIIFDSEHSRQDFMRLFPYDIQRTRVIHLGVDASFHPRPPEALAATRAKYGLDRPYLLFLGVNNPNKNLLRLVEAYSRCAARRDLQLVLAGPLRPQPEAQLRQRLRELDIESTTRMLGYLNAADVPLLYAGAAALMLPSIYEGFGLPILEAMASAIPVLASTAASCPEVAAGHAVLVDPASVDDIASGIDRVLTLTAEQIEAARRYAVGKTWRATALQTLEVYRDVS
ncbi:MAG TPA: glycosyltransferase family 1 protein [Nevskiaceae bacterium]|nr:glycosyltransferase family 1 protein [Nevskiaceae bacterium]